VSDLRAILVAKLHTLKDNFDAQLTPEINADVYKNQHER
jgi:hypothetical protein